MLFDHKSQEGYTIWKEIIGTMIGIAPFAVLFFVWMASVQTRLAVLEEARTSQLYRDSAQDATTGAGISRIETNQGKLELTLRELDRYLRESRR